MNDERLAQWYRDARESTQAEPSGSALEVLARISAGEPVSESERDLALRAIAEYPELAQAQALALELAPESQALAQALGSGAASSWTTRVDRHARPFALAAGVAALALIAGHALRPDPGLAPRATPSAAQSKPGPSNVILHGSFEAESGIAAAHDGDRVFRGDFDG